MDTTQDSDERCESYCYGAKLSPLWSRLRAVRTSPYFVLGNASGKVEAFAWDLFPGSGCGAGSRVQQHAMLWLRRLRSRPSLSAGAALLAILDLGGCGLGISASTPSLLSEAFVVSQFGAVRLRPC